MALIMSKARPLFRADLRGAPAHPLGERVFLRPLPIAGKTEGGLEIADIAKERTFAGLLLAAGDQAADKLYDVDFRIGDEVWYGKYAGVIEEWQHIVYDGEIKCSHETVWEFVPRNDPRWSAVRTPDEDQQLRACRACGALKLSERVIALSVDDIICSVDAQVRLDSGETKRVRSESADGRTRYVIKRPSGFIDLFETPGKEQ